MESRGIYFNGWSGKTSLLRGHLNRYLSIREPNRHLRTEWWGWEFQVQRHGHTEHFSTPWRAVWLEWARVRGVGNEVRDIAGVERLGKMSTCHVHKQSPSASVYETALGWLWSQRAFYTLVSWRKATWPDARLESPTLLNPTRKTH